MKLKPKTQLLIALARDFRVLADGAYQMIGIVPRARIDHGHLIAAAEHCELAVERLKKTTLA